MSFGENVRYYREQLKITQEELAEKLYISRQTVSRWETDSTFPDVEMLIKLCDIFNCDLDTLVRKDARQQSCEAPTTPQCAAGNLAAYDRHMNKFALLIAIGVGIIIFGVASLIFISGFWAKELLGTVTLFTFIGLAVTDFIITGINHTNYMRENPQMPRYPEERIQKFSRIFPFLISLATALAFFALIALIIMCYATDYITDGFTKDQWEHFCVSIFLLLLSVCAFIYVYTGILHSKYNTDQYNAECAKAGWAKDDDAPQDKKSAKAISDTVCAVIMLGAVACFLALGFFGNLWHPAWAVFPIGGILCGICSIIAEAISKK